MTKHLKWQALIFNVCIMLNCLMLFLLFFGSQMQVPLFVKVLGRAHPLVLHFPIVLLLLAFVFEILAVYSKQVLLKTIADWILLGASLTTVIAALMGIFLSKEEGYDGSGVVVHQWLGIICSLLSFLWFGLRNLIRKSRIATVLTGSLASFFLLAAGHYGANLTHGDDFLLAPIRQTGAAPSIQLADAVVYQHLVKPIIDQKCLSCHNSSKAKGGLVMETEQSLLKGGKNGKLWNLDEANFGLMMQRIHLPPEHKEHMPPKGKLQLTDDEVRILHLWIKGGASLTKKVTALPANDSLRLVAANYFDGGDDRAYQLPALDRGKVEKLNNDYRTVTPLDAQSDAVAVDFYGATQFKPQQLNELEAIKNNIVSLQLSKMPIGDDDLKTIGRLVELRSLNLSFTNIKGGGLKSLAKLDKLKELSLSGTGVTRDMLKPLKPLKNLKAILVWNTGISPKDLASLKADFPRVQFDLGFNGEKVVAKLNMPVIEMEKKIFKNQAQVKMKSLIKGAVIRYTLDDSEPDSVASPIYEGPFSIDKTVTIKAKSFLKGWTSSNTVEEHVYKSNFKPDSIRLQTLPDKRYPIKSSQMLFDGELGTFSFSVGGPWMAYIDKPLEAYFFFKQPTEVSSVALRSLVDIVRHIMPPHEIQVFGGNSATSLSLLKKLNPKQPANQVDPFDIYIENYICSFEKKKVSVIKLVVKPLAHLPAWHAGKGDSAWIFVDEVFLN